MKPNVANAQTLLDTFCGTKVPRRSTANLQKKISRSCQIMIHAQILPDLLAPFGSTLFFLALPACKAKAKYQLALSQVLDWQLAFRSVSLSNLCAKHISAPVHAPCQILIHWQISMSENATAQLSGWNIKTAKLQSALAICCGRQRTAKCFVKSTRVRKPPNENAFGMGWLPPCHQFKSYHLHLHVDGWLLLVFVHPPGTPGTVRNAFVHCFPVY